MTVQHKKFTKLMVQALEILLISVFSTATMSGGILWIKQGIGQDFLFLWLKEFLLACCISIPSGYLIVPLVVHYTKRFKE
ncbi:DUF2798 domain-containing protein [Mucilaginibacter sp.]|uniref:DUF2798 domain-containing protein n=1 Tax=Mucilaginibacter sp. TaxID=1882438 RepID=UPI002627B6D0|nr:DUF2798 domain-containing protein [Mucilaginibacter sp.]